MKAKKKQATRMKSWRGWCLVEMADGLRATTVLQSREYTAALRESYRAKVGLRIARVEVREVR